MPGEVSRQTIPRTPEGRRCAIVVRPTPSDPPWSTNLNSEQSGHHGQWSCDAYLVSFPTLGMTVCDSACGMTSCVSQRGVSNVRKDITHDRRSDRHGTGGRRCGRHLVASIWPDRARSHPTGIRPLRHADDQPDRSSRNLHARPRRRRHEPGSRAHPRQSTLCGRTSGNRKSAPSHPESRFGDEGR